MPQHEYRDVGGQLCADEGGHVGEHTRRRSRLALVAVLLHAPAPAPLIQPVDGDPALGEVGEEPVVPVDVVAEAVEHDHLGFDGTIGLDFRILADLYV